MRVLILPAWYPRRENPVHGIFVRDQARAMATDHDVAVLFLEPGDPVGAGRIQISDSVDDRVLTVRVRAAHGRLRKARLVAGLVAALRRLRARGFRPDLVHAHVFTLGAVGVLLGRVLRLPVVVSEHYSLFPRRLASRRDLALARLAFGGAEIVAPVSESLREAIEAYGLRGRFRVVPNAVDTTLFAAPAGERGAGPEPRVLFVGGLVPIKGMRRLLHALRDLSGRGRQYRLDVVGDGPERPGDETLAAELGIADRVAFHGSLPREQVAELMRAADVLVQPSESETLSCVVLEAQASGLPVVASRVGGIPEVVAAGTGVLVEPGDEAALAAGIEEALRRPDRFDREGIARAAAERFGPAATATRWAEVYAEALELARRRRLRPAR